MVFYTQSDHKALVVWFMIGTMLLALYFTKCVCVCLCMKGGGWAFEVAPSLCAAPAFNLNCGITHRTTRKHTLVRHSLNFSSSIYSSWRCRFSFIARVSSNVYIRLKHWNRWNTIYVHTFKQTHAHSLSLNPKDGQISQSLRDARDMFDGSFLIWCSIPEISRFMPSSSALQIKPTTTTTTTHVSSTIYTIYAELIYKKNQVVDCVYMCVCVCSNLCDDVSFDACSTCVSVCVCECVYNKI